MLLKSYLLFINIIYFNIIVSGLQFNILNNCNYNIPIYSHENNNFINKCNLKPYESCIIDYNKIESGLIKTSLSENATLFEFTINDFGIFYDLSVIPPGSGICYSYLECYNISKKTSFNIPIKIIVDIEYSMESCVNLECLEDQCVDAYLYPYDDLKTHFCKINNNDIFNIIYCPNNINNDLECE